MLNPTHDCADMSFFFYSLEFATHKHACTEYNTSASNDTCKLAKILICATSAGWQLYRDILVLIPCS